MTSYMTSFSELTWWRRAATVVSFSVAAFAATGCAVADYLVVEDPDIVNPSDVSSAAGANAVRLGALARFNSATSGGESLFLLGGLFADEWNNGDSFIARQEIDQRVITPQNNFLTDANRTLHRARLSAEQAVGLLEEFSPTSPGWQRGEMYFVQAYVENMIAEHYCSGIIFSTVIDGGEDFGSPITTTQAFERALEHANAGLALVTGTSTDDARVRNALSVLKGRILVNLNRHSEAATAVSGVPTNFGYEEFHSQTTNSNQAWSFNNLARRYSVSTGEGTNGLDFATADDPRVPVCEGGDTECRAIGVTNATRDDLTRPFYVQMMWAVPEASVTIVSGVEARMIEAEAQLKAGDGATALATLNAARTTVSGLAPLADAGSDAARVDQLFRERAFWMFSTGHRVGDLRRLVRQYGRAASATFPTGAWHKGGNYGTDVTLPIPLSETNNPNLSGGGTETCIDRNP